MILGFDTSNYTTSICLISQSEVVFEARTLIKVKLGQQGIRQSDAYFQHMQVLHEWCATHLSQYASHLKAVAVSTRPRPLETSYMPVFKAGHTIALTIAKSLGLPLYETSHQEGHFAAAFNSSKLKVESSFSNLAKPLLFLHLSGGTTEMHMSQGLKMQCLAQTADISLGQLVDRIGVAAGLAFPCGPQMDRLAQEHMLLSRSEIQDQLLKSQKLVPHFKMSENFNLSGYENFFKNELSKNQDHPERVYSQLFEFIKGVLVQLILWGYGQTGASQVLLAGGVAASYNLRTLLLADPRVAQFQIYFSEPYYASDNAFGVALIGENLSEMNE